MVGDIIPPAMEVTMPEVRGLRTVVVIIGMPVVITDTVLTRVAEGINPKRMAAQIFYCTFIRRIKSLKHDAPSYRDCPFILYALYRLLIARDAKKHRFELVLGSIFTLIWGVIYFLILI